jgi:hypothetical protein
MSVRLEGTMKLGNAERPVMLDTAPALTILTIMEVVGPVVLAAALVYGLMVASRRSRSTRSSDAATRQMHEQNDQ